MGPASCTIREDKALQGDGKEDVTWKARLPYDERTKRKDQVETSSEAALTQGDKPDCASTDTSAADD